MSLYIRTPLKPLVRINEKYGKNISVKLECYQPDGSFKIRGVSRVVEDAKARGIKHIICGSGGNAGHAATCCAAMLGLKCTIVIPQTASGYMAEVLRRDGANVIVHGEVFDDARDYAMKLVENDKDAMFMHPFDLPLLWEGHSTIVDELKEQTSKPDVIICALGGGGLFNGIVQGLDRNGWSDVPIIAVEVEGAPKFRRALEAGHPVELEHIDTLANTLAGRIVSAQTLEYAKTHNVTSHLVSDERAANAVVQFIEDFRILVELACGAPMSVVYDQPDIIAPYKNIVVIACGGAGVNLPLLLDYKQRFNL
ncbi:MAG: pyridoxal-phosphate dependent enzyme [Clostridia bacterium]